MAKFQNCKKLLLKIKRSEEIHVHNPPIKSLFFFLEDPARGWYFSTDKKSMMRAPLDKQDNVADEPVHEENVYEDVAPLRTYSQDLADAVHKDALARRSYGKNLAKQAYLENLMRDEEDDIEQRPDEFSGSSSSSLDRARYERFVSIIAKR